jgi:hypothetical protein
MATALKRFPKKSAFAPQKATRRETAPRNPAILLFGRYLPFFAFGAAFAGAAAAPLGAAFAAGLAAGFFSAMVLPLAFQY